MRAAWGWLGVDLGVDSRVLPGFSFLSPSDWLPVFTCTHDELGHFETGGKQVRHGRGGLSSEWQ